MIAVPIAKKWLSTDSSIPKTQRTPTAEEGNRSELKSAYSLGVVVNLNHKMTVQSAMAYRDWAV